MTAPREPRLYRQGASLYVIGTSDLRTALAVAEISPRTHRWSSTEFGHFVRRKQGWEGRSEDSLPKDAREGICFVGPITGPAPRELSSAPAEAGVSLALNETGTAYRVKETSTHFIEVAPMLYNHRIMLVPKRLPTVVDRYWCYRDGVVAILAALAWDGADDSEPTGWIKSWEQRYSDAFLDEMSQNGQPFVPSERFPPKGGRA